MKCQFFFLALVVALFNPLVVQAEESEEIRAYVQELREQCHGTLAFKCRMTRGASIPQYCEGNSINYNNIYDDMVKIHNKKDKNKQSFYEVRRELNDLCGTGFLNNYIFVKNSEKEIIRSYVTELRVKCGADLTNKCSRPVTGSGPVPYYCKGKSWRRFVNYQKIVDRAVELHKKDKNKKSFYAAQSELNNVCGKKLF
jgi:hypothetical protein